MIGAIVRNNIVENVIIVDPSSVSELETALGCEIVDANPYGLAIGDLRTPNGWTRNAGGEQMLLPLLEAEEYDSYHYAIERAVNAEQQLETVANETVDEVLAILSGEVEE